VDQLKNERALTPPVFHWNWCEIPYPKKKPDRLFNLGVTYIKFITQYTLYIFLISVGTYVGLIKMMSADHLLSLSDTRDIKLTIVSRTLCRYSFNISVNSLIVKLKAQNIDRVPTLACLR